VLYNSTLLYTPCYITGWVLYNTTPVKVPDLIVDQGLQAQSEVQRAEQAKNEQIPLFFSRAAGRRRRGIHAIAATLDMKISITPFGSGYKGGVRVGRLCQRGNAHCDVLQANLKVKVGGE
jgi:hypothetical protein